MADNFLDELSRKQLYKLIVVREQEIAKLQGLLNSRSGEAANLEIGFYSEPDPDNTKSRHPLCETCAFSVCVGIPQGFDTENNYCPLFISK